MTTGVPFAERLKDLGYDSYKDYLASGHWGRFKAKYRRSSRPQECQACGAARVDLHHVTYKRLGRERLTDVLPLCRTHHEAVHAWLKERGESVRATPDAIRSVNPAYAGRPAGKHRGPKARPVEPGPALVAEWNKQCVYYARLRNKMPAGHPLRVKVKKQKGISPERLGALVLRIAEMEALLASGGAWAVQTTPPSPASPANKKRHSTAGRAARPEPSPAPDAAAAIVRQVLRSRSTYAS